jgi:glycosyltransferase involved in cell wall biosynthesis
MGVIQDCDLGIYPRQVDHKRSILKIYSYIGAGIPIVGFDLIDTKIVKDYNLGVLVKSKEELIDRIIELSKDNQTYLRYKSNVYKIRNLFTWNVLAHKLEKNVHE